MDKIKKHQAIFKQLSLTSSDETVDKWDDIMEDYARDVGNYYRYYARHVWDIDVRGFAMRGEDSPFPPSYGQDDQDSYMEEHPELFADAGFYPNYRHIIGGTHPNYCGQARIGGDQGVTYNGIACGKRTTTHEWGHNLGMHHASDYDQNDVLKEYGDHTCMMGNAGSTNMTGLNAPHLLQMGLETIREVLYVERSQQVLLAPVEMNQHSMHEMEYQTAVMSVPTMKSKYFASLRKTLGVKYSNGDHPSKHYLYIHEHGSVSQTIRLHSMSVGSVLTLPNGFRIEYLEYKDETARVNIWMPGDTSELADIPMPSGLPELMKTMTATEQHSGTWDNPDFPNQGINFMVKNGRAVIHYYTYNEKREDRRSYHGSASGIDGGAITFDLYTSVGGTVADPTLSTPVKVGTASVGFFDDTHGVFSYETEELGRQAMELRPVALGGNAMSGEFFQPSRDGEGFTLQFFDRGQVAGIWFGYGRSVYVQPPTQAITTQRWYVVSGGKQPDGTYNLKVWEFREGEWNSFDTPIRNEVGSAVLTVLDEDHLKYGFDLKGVGAVHAGTYNLERLF